MPERRGDVTQLLARWANGDRAAFDGLMPIVYGELRQIADGYLRRERSGHTLQPTALVNEAWLRLARQEGLKFDHRKQFYALAAQAMRRILVDHARRAGRGQTWRRRREDDAQRRRERRRQSDDRAAGVG